MVATKIERDQMKNDVNIKQRMRNPGLVIPEAVKPIQDLYASCFKGGVSPKVISLVHIRTSQINGCSYCVFTGTQDAIQKGESLEKLLATSAWRESLLFTAPERAALALAESVTRLSDRPDPVSDEVWNEAAKYYDERGVAALLLAIATTNVFNRLNVPVKQIAQDWGSHSQEER